MSAPLLLDCLCFPGLLHIMLLSGQGTISVQFAWQEPELLLLSCL